MTPTAHADGFDVIIDPIINSISSIDPMLGTDLTAALGDFTTSSGWDSVLADFSSLDSLFGASSVASVVPDTNSAASDISSAASSARWVRPTRSSSAPRRARTIARPMPCRVKLPWASTPSCRKPSR